MNTRFVIAGTSLLAPRSLSFSKSGLLDDDYGYGDFKSLLEKDENFRAFILHKKALKRAKSAITKILQDKAEKNKREEDTDSTDSEDSTESENDKADESVVIAVGLHPETNESRLSKMELRSFILKLWLRRIELTKNED